MIKEDTKMLVNLLIADTFPEGKIDDLIKIGCTVIYDQSLKEDALLEALEKEQPDILIVRSTVVTGAMIRSNSQLSLIIRAGSGYNTIDVKTASERSVYVANCPGQNSVAVAELAFGLILRRSFRSHGAYTDGPSVSSASAG
jgi:D-3-phosphoglycerate dehydrogenase